MWKNRVSPLLTERLRYIISEFGPIVGKLIAGGIPLIAGGLMLVYGLLTCFTVWAFDRTRGTISLSNQSH
jgi:hypothetical protein